MPRAARRCQPRGARYEVNARPLTTHFVIGGDLRPIVVIALPAAICAAQVLTDEVAKFRHGPRTGEGVA